MARPRKPDALTAAERMRAYRLRQSGAVTEMRVTGMCVTKTPVTEMRVTKTPVTETAPGGRSIHELLRLNGGQLGFWVRRIGSSWGFPMQVVSVDLPAGEVCTHDGWRVNKASEPIFELVAGMAVA